ncbi:MAG: hypothetical protein OHK0019_35580 [Saprospiraceae bacterium]
MTHAFWTNRPQHTSATGRTVQSLSLVQYIFEEIRQLLPGDKSLAKELAIVLNIGESAVYKKLRGDNPLTLEEAAALAQHFHLSLDNYLLPQKGVVPMIFYPLVEQTNGPLDFLRRLFANIEKAIQLPGSSLHYATVEIPVFNYLHFPELTAFKLFVWGRSTWEFDEQNIDFHPETLAANEEMNYLRTRILHCYHCWPSTEFWTLHMLDNTLSQIRYFSDQHVFRDNAFPARLLAQIGQLLEHQQKMAASGRKHLPNHPPEPDAGTFRLFHNEMAPSGNTLLVQSADRNAVYFTFDNPDFFQTSDLTFVAYAPRWFDRLQKRSTPLSGSAERQRVRFFKTLEKRMKEWNKLAKY